VTTKGSTFTIRRFRADPITATDLIMYKTMSSEMVAFMWLVVENGVNALIAGGTASGKTSTLNAISLFIPRESKIVSIEETREINLPHPNWIPGVVRSGFGEVIHDKLAGEIDLYDLMKAALRQRPEYILVGEIRGKEAYVLFQAMATGHTTYSTFHADSAESLIHRLEGKPIDIPRIMLQSLDIVTIQVQAEVGNQLVRRCKQIVEIVDIDPISKEILTNEVFHWDPVKDEFYYSGKSYVLERIRSQHGISKEEMMFELKRRIQILEWMRDNNIRAFKDVARMIASYLDTPEEIMSKISKKSEPIQKPPEIVAMGQMAEKQDINRPGGSFEGICHGK
jgi:archaeal flagellar protein FlaI